MSPTATRVNDFTIKIATVNGTGSGSSNTLLMKSIFRSGIPVVGKNYFPSNIQGLPTWYEIRVTRAGYVCVSGRVDIMVAMNAETYSKDVREVSSGGYLVYDSTWPRPALLKIDFISSVLALAEPVPLTVAILMTKSLIEVGGVVGIAFARFRRSWAGGPARRPARRRPAGSARWTSACPRRPSDSARRTDHSARTDPRP